MLLKSKRILLRPLQDSDKEAFFAYRSDSKANKYQGWIPKTKADVNDFFEKLASTPNQADSWFQWAIVEQKNNKLIGDIGTRFWGSTNQQVELGFTLDKIYQRKGYATEALLLLIHHLFADLKEHRISASAHPANEASIRLLEKLGFRKEAHFVEGFYQHGEWVDDVVYALLAREWEGLVHMSE